MSISNCHVDQGKVECSGPTADNLRCGLRLIRSAIVYTRVQVQMQEINMKLAFSRLSDVNPAEWVALLTHPLVRRHMPLSGATMTLSEARDWAAAKDRQWDAFGYGPWALFADGELVGWGGLQDEDGEADLALVLHPDHWGKGPAFAREIIRRAFEELGLASITALLPPSRTRVKGMQRLGFEFDSEVWVDGERFVRYRLLRPAAGQTENHQMPGD